MSKCAVLRRYEPSKQTVEGKTMGVGGGHLYAKPGKGSNQQVSADNKTAPNLLRL